MMLAGKKFKNGTYLKNVRNSDKEEDKADDCNEDLVATEVLVQKSTVFYRRDDDLHGSELEPDIESFAEPLISDLIIITQNSEGAGDQKSVIKAQFRKTLKQFRP